MDVNIARFKKVFYEEENPFKTFVRPRGHRMPFEEEECTVNITFNSKK